MRATISPALTSNVTFLNNQVLFPILLVLSVLLLLLPFQFILLMVIFFPKVETLSMVGCHPSDRAARDPILQGMAPKLVTYHTFFNVGQ